MIRLLLADDEELVRTGLRMILSTEDDIEVVGEAGDGAAAVDLAARHRPDIALLDVRMPRVTGIDVLPRLPPATRAIMLTTFDLDEYVYAALRVGAAGFLLKTDPATTLIHAVRVVAAGGALLAPAVTRRLIEEFARQVRPVPDARIQSLSTREKEVLRLIAYGMSNAEIATRLFLAPTTVKTHVASLLTKLHCRDRTQAGVLAYESGLVVPGHGHST